MKTLIISALALLFFATKSDGSKANPVKITEKSSSSYRPSPLIENLMPLELIKYNSPIRRRYTTYNLVVRHFAAIVETQITYSLAPGNTTTPFPIKFGFETKTAPGGPSGGVVFYGHPVQPGVETDIWVNSQKAKFIYPGTNGSTCYVICEPGGVSCN